MNKATTFKKSSVRNFHLFIGYLINLISGIPLLVVDLLGILLKKYSIILYD